VTDEDAFQKLESVEYRDMPGFPGYRAGSDGSVWTAWRRGPAGKGAGQGKRRFLIGNGWRRISPKLSANEYPRISFSRVGQRGLVWPVHRAILLAFVGPKPAALVCRHRDGNKHNNALSNLSYGTQKENVEDAIRHGTLTHGEKHPCAKLNSDSVRVIRTEVASGTTLDVLAARFHVDRNAVWLAATRRTWKHVE
jgi:hypothetical protein